MNFNTQDKKINSKSSTRKHTEKTKELIRKSVTNGFKNNNRIVWNKGLVGCKGHVPWNKGLKGYKDIKGSETRKRLYVSGKLIPWNKGLKGDIRLGKPWLGKKHSDDEKQKTKNTLLNFYKNRKSHLFGKKLSEEHKRKLKLARKNLIIPYKDTKIEIKIQDYLKQLGIEFYTHQYMKIEHDYQTDIFIPYLNLVIECDGDYWHGNILKYPNPQQWQLDQIEEDRIRTEELKEKGYNVLRLWENEIKKMSLEEFKLQLNIYAEVKKCRKY